MDDADLRNGIKVHHVAKPGACPAIGARGRVGAGPMALDCPSGSWRTGSPLIFYDHWCHGRSVGAPVSSMTWENLTADADALRQELGFMRLTVLGHSFGDQVALEYALRNPASLSHLVLLDTCVRDGIGGTWRAKMRPEAMIFAGRELWPGWTVMDRLGEISVPTPVLAGRDDVFSPPEHQGQLAAGLAYARLQIIGRAGHDPYSERPAEIMAAVRGFLSADAPMA